MRDDRITSLKCLETILHFYCTYFLLSFTFRGFWKHCNLKETNKIQKQNSLRFKRTPLTFGKTGDVKREPVNILIF